MKQLTLLSLLCYCLLAATLQAQTPTTKPKCQANQLLLHLQAGVAEAQQTNEVLDMLQAPTEKTQTIAGTDVLIVQIPDALTIAGKRLTNPQAIADYFQNNPHPYIDYVEPNYLYSIDSTPNDPSYGNLWGMDKIQAPQAWDIDHDCSDVIVGVIDTGIDWTHPDLIDNIWQNLGEDADGDGHVLEYIGGTWQFDPGDINNVDNDGNGYADDFVGWDFVNNDNNPLDDQSHGTHCAGAIGARGNNNIGVAGVCWNVKLMALKFLSASGGGSTSGAIAALNYATDKGVKITNNSWGGGGYSTPLYNAIQNAQNNNALFVAAAGNYAMNNDATPFYPASYNNANIIAVASSTSSDALSSFSHYGATSVDLAAPGSGIYSTTPNNTYGYKSGTSMATPHVAGAAALVRCASMTYADVKAALLNNTTPLASLTGKCVTGGRLNLYNALANTNCCNVTAAFTMPTAPFCINQALSFTNTSANATTYEWKVDNVTQSNTANFTYTFTTSGTHTVTLIASNGNCNDAVTQTVTLNTTANPAFTHTETDLTTTLTAIAGATSYSWDFGDGITSTTQNTAHTYAAAGTYNVCLTVVNGCGSVSECESVVVYANCADEWSLYTIPMLGIYSELSIDAQGNKWVGTHELTRFDGNNWVNYTLSNSGMPANSGIEAITIDNQDNKWIGTLGGGLVKFDNNNWTVYNTTNSGLANNSVNAVVIDTQGNKWIGTDSGITKFDGTNWTSYNETNCPALDYGVSSIAIDQQGNKWIGTGGYGLVKFDGTTWTTYNTSNSELPTNIIRAIEIDAQGNKWIGTYNGGIAKFDGSTWVVYNTTNSGLLTNDAYDLDIDAQGNIWVACWETNYSADGGLVKFNGTTWTNYTTANSDLPYNSSHAIEVDPNGNKWLLSGGKLVNLGNCTPPTTCWQTISAGGQYNIALKTDGTLWAWGLNNYGQLGNGTTTNSSIPTQIGTDNDWKNISANYGHVMALKQNGTLWAWGWNLYGQLGDGTRSNKYIPTQIGIATDWKVISTGWNHSIAIKENGTLWTWGGNWSGQLGDGVQTIDRLLPAQIGVATDWKYISGSVNRTFAIKTNGTLWACGFNGNSELGNGTTQNSFSLLQIGTDNTWQSINGGYFNTYGIKNNNTLWAWGLSSGTTPTQFGSSSDWSSIVCSSLSTANHIAAIKTNSTLWTWGSNNNGQLGNGTNTNNNTPMQITTETNWQYISVGDKHSAAIKSDGTLWSWGYNGYGQLGEGTNTDKNTPTFISGCTTTICSTTAQFTLPTTNLCKNAPLTFTNTSTSATTYQWLVDNTPISTATNLTHTFTTAGTHTVKLIASNGTCSNELIQTITVDGNCVYPGDANADGTVNMLDWLALGLAFDATGAPRADQTIDYTAKQATDFATSHTGNLFTGINHKHADSNGNGTVEITDSTAITQNYGLVHALGATTITPSNSPEVLLSTESNTPVVAQSTPAYIDITIQNALNGGAISTYGMAFSVSYAGGSNPQLSFAGSCLGTLGIDFIATTKNNPVAKKLYVGITRTNHTNINTYGKVATMQVTIDELPAGNPLMLTMPVDETVVNDNNGYIIPSGAGSAAMMEAYEYVSQTPAILLKAKALLQGAMTEISLDDAVMTTSFNPTIPTQQPYNVAPWNYAGTETGTIPPNAVDWVLIELRNSLNPTQIALQKAVLLLNDGSLQDIGTPIQANAVALDGLIANQSYTLTIRHRNHLAVKSSNAIAITNNVLAYDFTQSATQTQGGAAQLAFVNNRYALKQLVTPIITGTNTLCNNATATYTHSNPVSGNNYTWAVTGGTIVSGQNSNNLVVQWTTGTSGTISRQDQSTLNTTVFNVSLNPAPDAIVSVGGNASGGGTPGLTSYNLCTTCKVYLKSNYTNLTTYTLKWYKNNNELTQYQNYLGGNVKKAGNYKLKVIRNSTGCEDFSQTVVITGGAPMAAYNTNPNIDNSSESAKNEEDLFETDDEMLQFQLYPNPAKGTTQLYYQLALQQTATLQITDLMGKQLQQITLSNSGTHTIDLNNYPNGIYLCQMMIDGKLISTQKLVVM